MEKKVLVVDDSQTIQKVVSITLASQPYSLVPCLNEEELFRSLDDSTSLLLLDYTLTEGKTGLDLAAEVHAKISKVPILMMLGTFDSVSDAELSSAGVQDKIVKPFESEKFIRKCQELIESAEESLGVTSFLNKEEMVGEEASEEEERASSIEGWIVESPLRQDASDVTQEIEIVNIQNETSSVEDMLEHEAQSWSGSVPDSIEGESLGVTFMPPVIEGSIEVTEMAENFEEAEALPEEDDLDYPSIGSPIEDLQNVQLSSSLIPLEDLLPGNEEETEEEETRGDFNISFNLQEEVNANVPAGDFWAVDSKNQSSEKRESGATTTLEEVTVEASAQVENLSGFENQDELVSKIKEELGPVIEKLVKNFCAQKIEQIAWEVIPDLAENLIRKELTKISDSVID